MVFCQIRGDTGIYRYIEGPQKSEQHLNGNADFMCRYTYLALKKIYISDHRSYIETHIDADLWRKELGSGKEELEMEKYLIATRYELTGKRKLTLQYYLLARHMGGGTDQFGIMIRASEEDYTALVQGVSSDGLEILRLIERLADGTVTPIGLQDILLDLQ